MNRIASLCLSGAAAEWQAWAASSIDTPLSLILGGPSKELIRNRCAPKRCSGACLQTRVEAKNLLNNGDSIQKHGCLPHLDRRSRFSMTTRWLVHNGVEHDAPCRQVFGRNGGGLEQMSKGEPGLSSELKNFDSRSSGILATGAWTSRGSAAGADFPSCWLNHLLATMRTYWRIELLILGSLDCFEAGELWMCVQGNKLCI